MKKIAVVLSGCGYLDGAEITETVGTLISIGQAGASYVVFAPNVEFACTNHQSGQTTDNSRNVLAEAARISRGSVKELAQLNANDFDAVVFPGGYGAAQILAEIPKVTQIIKDFHSQTKPIGALCIAPTLVARALGDLGVTVTIGNDKDTATTIESMGAEHVDCNVTDYVTDRENKVITTPAYMYEAQPHQVFQGINGAIKELVEMA